MILLIAEVRKSKKVTQAELAEMTGINQRMISRFETGMTVPRLDQLIAIMKALGAQWDDVVEL
ncbi:transcriptional regulator [Xanthomonas phage vB_XveM_DIBBI]|uniref:Regulatory protein n=2 Tax=Dibbivirus TaxID=2843374 RepID=I3PGW3_9CAUD|nr:transcriptional regulator [Xanthomonas phage vB_XveM_DIBBI]YP_009845879.1 transcriptional regulator [Pantoea phage vB_PagM_AAM37]AEX65698.1 regulatory protein [Xanthomonas phage vB_XveM_DIBBI]QDH45702.1 XRE-family transcriptional regulator [Pantoea phage vB_PagM_AAM37]